MITTARGKRILSNSLHLSLREWPRLPFTARIERAPFHRARSASKKGTWRSLPCWRAFSTSCHWIMGGISYEGKPAVETWTSPISFPCRLQDSYGTVTQEPVRHCLRDEAKEMRPDARPQARKNRRRIHWNTLRIFQGRKRRRW